MARQPDGAIVDVSLFESSPVDDTHFNYPSTNYNHFRPTYPPMNRPQIHVSSWDDIPQEFRPLPPRANVRKPLPPLPNESDVPRDEFGFGPLKKCRADGPGSRCILSRIRRSKSESHHLASNIREIPTWPVTSEPEAGRHFPTSHAQHSSSATQTSAGPSNWDPRIHSSQLVWMPDEQMWLVREGVPSATEPTLVLERRYSNDFELRPIYQYHAVSTVEPPSLNDDSLSPFDPPPSYWSANYENARSARGTHWDTMARRLQRPSSAGTSVSGPWD